MCDSSPASLGKISLLYPSCLNFYVEKSIVVQDKLKHLPDTPVCLRTIYQSSLLAMFDAQYLGLHDQDRNVQNIGSLFLGPLCSLSFKRFVCSLFTNSLAVSISVHRVTANILVRLLSLLFVAIMYKNAPNHILYTVSQKWGTQIMPQNSVCVPFLSHSVIQIVSGPSGRIRYARNFSIEMLHKYSASLTNLTISFSEVKVKAQGQTIVGYLKSFTCNVRYSLA